MICLAPRAQEDSVRPRRLAGVIARPLSFTVRSRVVRVWAFVLSWVVAVPVILYGALFLAAAGVEAYMVAFGGVKPGDEVFPGSPATPLQESLVQVGIGAAIIAVGFFVRSYARRLRLGDS